MSGFMTRARKKSRYEKAFQPGNDRIHDSFTPNRRVCSSTAYDDFVPSPWYINEQAGFKEIEQQFGQFFRGVAA